MKNFTQLFKYIILLSVFLYCGIINNNLSYLIWMMLWIIITLIFLDILSHDKLGTYALGIFRPMNFLLIFLLVIYSIGPISHYLLEKYNSYYSYTTDYSYSFKLLILVTISLFSGHLLFGFLRKLFGLRKVDYVDLRNSPYSVFKLEALCTISIVVSIAAFIYLYAKSGIVPFFHIGDVDYLRFELFKRKDAGIFGRIGTFGIVGSATSLTLLGLGLGSKSVINKGIIHNKYLILLNVCFFSVMFLYGAKMPIFLPITIAVFNYNYCVKRINIFKMKISLMIAKYVN
ncbi:MAG: hypothetical protein IH819_12620 [Bacteroidetes bacterium]|nr:hypothetical protein [Bacteroidota bacterium]